MSKDLTAVDRKIESQRARKVCSIVTLASFSCALFAVIHLFQIMLPTREARSRVMPSHEHTNAYRSL